MLVTELVDTVVVIGTDLAVGGSGDGDDGVSEGVSGGGSNVGRVGGVGHGSGLDGRVGWCVGGGNGTVVGRFGSVKWW